MLERILAGSAATDVERCAMNVSIQLNAAAQLSAELVGLPPVGVRCSNIKSTPSGLAVRFSGFGRLVTVWGNVPDSLPSDALKVALAAVLEASGYRYVPEIALEEPYRGRNQHSAQIGS